MKREAKAALIVAAVAAGVFGLWRYSSTSELSKYRAELEAHLKDPASVQYRSEVLVKDQAGTTYCGIINAKNSFGGYIGFRYVILHDGELVLEPDDVAPDSRDVKAMDAKIAFLNLLLSRCGPALEAAGAKR